jgi:hypothetical protein
VTFPQSNFHSPWNGLNRGRTDTVAASPFFHNVVQGNPEVKSSIIFVEGAGCNSHPAMLSLAAYRPRACTSEDDERAVCVTWPDMEQFQNNLSHGESCRKLEQTSERAARSLAEIYGDSCALVNATIHHPPVMWPSDRISFPECGWCADANPELQG